MKMSIHGVRKHLAKPLTWLMVLAMLSPLSPHITEGIALCIGEGHVGVEATGASHHEDGRTAALALAETIALAETKSETQQASSSHHPLIAAAGESEAPSRSECSDVPLHLVKAGDACYQAVQSGEKEDVPPPMASQNIDFVHVGDAALSAPNDSGASEPHSPRATTPPSPPASSSTVVLLI